MILLALQTIKPSVQYSGPAGLWAGVALWARTTHMGNRHQRTTAPALKPHHEATVHTLHACVP